MAFHCLSFISKQSWLHKQFSQENFGQTQNEKFHHCHYDCIAKNNSIIPNCQPIVVNFSFFLMQTWKRWVVHDAIVKFWNYFIWSSVSGDFDFSILWIICGQNCSGDNSKLFWVVCHHFCWGNDANLHHIVAAIKWLMNCHCKSWQKLFCKVLQPKQSHFDHYGTRTILLLLLLLLLQ